MSRDLTRRLVFFLSKSAPNPWSPVVEPGGKDRVLVDTRMLRAWNVLRNSTVVLKLVTHRAGAARRKQQVLRVARPNGTEQAAQRCLYPAARDAQRRATALDSIGSLYVG